ncbi:MAG: ribosomal protein S18-alanine N-acetyltransferase [Acidimicrobiia bacterium]|nr:ribosomal protein S18-alanine N-acetyltransferase [Acidimicrobiia bacterium]
MSIHIRPLDASDLDAVMEIEEASFVEPWSRAMFAEEIVQSTRRYLIALEGVTVCGYGGIMLAGEDAHLVTIAVAPGHRELGVASRLMIDLVEAARDGGASHLTLEVRESNEAALELYRKFGFEPAGVRKAYYTTEDAVVMWAVDIDSVDYQRTLTSIRKEAS